MVETITWPSIGGASWPIPEAGEVGWPTLTDFLVALQGAQSTTHQKFAYRRVTTSPVTVVSSSDCIIGSSLTVPAAVAVSLPQGVNGQIFYIVDEAGNAGTYNITITPYAGETINGGATLVMSVNSQSVGLTFVGTAWKVFSSSSTASAGVYPEASTTIAGIVGIGAQSFGGAKTFVDALAASATLTVAGASTLASLGVTGASNLSGSLSVAGATTLAAASLSGTLGVTGATTLSSFSSSGGGTVGTSLTVGTTLGVTGATTLASLAASGNISQSAGTTSLQATTVTGNITASAAVQGATVVSSGATTVGTTLAVTGGATVGGNLIVTGDLTVNGTQTYLNVSDIQVEDKNIDVNFNGTTAGAEGAGLTVLGTSNVAQANVIFAAAATSKFKVGTVGSEKEIATISDVQIFSNKTFQQDLVDDFLDFNEESEPATPAAGRVRVFGKNDGRIYKKTSAGNVSEIAIGLIPVLTASVTTAQAGRHYITNTSAGSFTITLPAGSTEAVIRFSDVEESWAAFPLTIAPATGEIIDGLAASETLVCDVRGAWLELNWTGAKWSLSSLATTQTAEASTTQTGSVNITTQSFAGAKTFTGAVAVQGALTPSAGITGRTDGPTIGAGLVGQTLVANASVAINTAATAFAVSSLSLTAGVWIVYASLFVAYETSLTYVEAAIHTAVDMTGLTNPAYAGAQTVNAVGSFGALSAFQYISVSVTTTVYLVGRAAGANNVTFTGGLRAVRIAA